MNDPSVITTPEAFHTAASADGVGAPGTDARPVRVPVEVRLTVDDPFEAYWRARDGEGGAFLETTGGQAGWGYFGVDPVDWLTVSPGAAPCGEERSPTLAALEGLLDGETLRRGDCTVPYPCGAIGWLSYDVARELEELPGSAADDRELPHLELAVYDRLAAWEEPREGETSLRIVACPRVGDDPDAAYERGRERALELVERIETGERTVGEPPTATREATFESTIGREAFAENVRRVKGYVHDGDTFQTNVSQRLVAPAAVHPVAAYDALRRVNPAPYSALLEFRAADLVSASPELLLERDGASLRTEPIAGTRPRGDGPAEDAELEADLLGDEKERAEHAMLVDLERNDMGKVCDYGSVEVAEYRRVDRYSAVMHLVSDVTGRLHEDRSLADAIAALFPGGTITGAPKPRTMEIIDELEATRRGPYTGSVGIFGFDGKATLNITIRTLVRYGEEYHLRVGAGIVHDSVPEAEYEETIDKARALIAAVDEALGERAAMAVETDGGRRGSGADDGGDPA